MLRFPQKCANEKLNVLISMNKKNGVLYCFIAAWAGNCENCANKSLHKVISPVYQFLIHKL